MTNYELTYIVSNQYTEKELETIKLKIDNILKKYDAVIGYQDSLGKKKLAYPIKKVANGYYLITEFELKDKVNIKKINDDLRLDKEIVRSLIITKPKITQAEIDRIKKHYNTETTDQKTSAPETRKRIVSPIKNKTKIERPIPADPKLETRKPDQKISIEKLDEKIDEILKDDNII